MAGGKGGCPAMGVLRQQAVAAIIHCKFGQLGARVVRVLLDKKLVEDKQVEGLLCAVRMLGCHVDDSRRFF